MSLANGLTMNGIHRFYTFSTGTEPEINSCTSTDGNQWIADDGNRLVLDKTSGLESAGLFDPSVVQLNDGRYLMVYVTKIP